MAYAAAGFARRLDGLDDDAVRDAFVADLHEVLPGTRGTRRGGRDQTLGARAALPEGRAQRRCSLPSRGRSRRFSSRGDYLGTLYTETAVQTGTAAAAGARSLLA